MNFSLRFYRLGFAAPFGLFLPVALMAQPAITNVSPAVNQRAAPRTSNVAVTFSEALNPGSEASLQVFSSQRGGERTGNSGTTALSGNVLSFAPAYDFKPGETVFATVTAAAQSASGSLPRPRVYQFTAAATGGTGTFQFGNEVPVGANPYIVLSADIDNDGDIDLLTPNFSASSNSVSVRLNNGSGAFSRSTNFAVGSQPRGLALGDFDGDGDLDFVTANYNANTASVRFNDGTGVFSGITELAVGSRPQSATVADVDGDGDLDVLVSNEGGNSVSVRLNNGSGAFSGGSEVSVGDFPFSMTVGDVDGDGDIDLITGDYRSTTVSIRLNNGNGAFGGFTSIGVGSQPRGVTTADLDGDNDLDLLVANAGSNSVSVLMNNGTGAFTLNSTLTVGSFPGGVTASDIDGDGDLDVLVPNIFSNTVSVRFNNGAGVFSSGNDVTVGSQPYRAGMSDIDSDGDLDMLVSNFASNSVSVRFNDLSTLTDLVVSTPQNVSGSYRNVTVTGPTTGGAGIATFTGTLNVVGTLTVQSGGTLLTDCQPLVGTGNFTLAAGGTLGICDPLGIQLTGTQGAVQVEGTRSFSNDASYIYNGTVAQTTGGALPSQVRNLTTSNANPVTLTAAETVVQVLTVSSTGNLVLNGRALLLPSTATGTALVVNSGTGIVQGTSATVQRYIDPANPGLGYRQFSAPVAGSTVADLATSGFAPVVNGSYNTSATPGQVTPFPTVFGYDQSRLATTSNNYSAFNKGWASPLSTAEALPAGRGYTVNIAGTEKVDFAGALNNGDVTLPLARNAGPAADAGWALVGNPYPAPLNWNLVSAADRPNLDASMYVFESSSQYNGTYRAYTNGIGTGNPLIGSSQGFFVRVSPGQTAGSLTFRNSQRVTSYATQVPFRKGTAETRPVVQLRLQGAAGPFDALFVYAEAGATSSFDPSYDASKLPNSTGLNLAAVTTDDSPLAIAGLDRFTMATVVPLSFEVPAAGTYTLRAEQLLNLPGNLTAYLFDLQTNQQINLSHQPAYTFAVTAPEAAQAQGSRFELHFSSAAAPLATKANAAVEVAVYPNPASTQLTLAAAKTTGGTSVKATLFNGLGQQVRSTVELSATGAPIQLPVADLASGVYMLRIQSGAESTVKRIVIQQK